MPKPIVDPTEGYKNNELEMIRINKLDEIDLSYKKAQKQGVLTSQGITMKCSMDDAATVRHVAEYYQRNSVATMTLKDINGNLTTDVAIADALTVSDEMAGNCMALWQNREDKKLLIENATTKEELEAISW